MINFSNGEVLKQQKKHNIEIFVTQIIRHNYTMSHKNLTRL